MNRSLLLISFFLFVLGGASSAQSFKVFPSSLEFKLEPGQSMNQEITVVNTSDRKESFVISASDLEFDEKGNYQFKPAGTSDRSCANNLTISPIFLELNPNESKKLNVMLKIPVGENQTAWGLVNIRSEKEYTGQAADKGVVRAGLVITPEIAVKILQVPPGLSDKKMTIERFIELEENPVDTVRRFAVNIVNEGDVPTHGKVYLILSNLDNLKEITFDPVELNIMPDTQKEIKLSVPKNLEKGVYSLAAILDYGEEFDLEGMEMEIEVLGE